MEAILPINPDSNAEQIQTFIEKVKDVLKSAYYDGILKHGMDISYNESYFGEKEGRLKSCLNETRHCFNGIAHYLDQVVVEDASAYDQVKDAMRGIHFAVSMVSEAMGYATGRYAISDYDPEKKEDRDALALRMKEFFSASDMAEDIFNSATDSKSLIEKLEVLSAVAKSSGAEPRDSVPTEDTPSVESEEEEEDPSESEDHVAPDDAESGDEAPELDDGEEEDDDESDDDVFSEMKEWIGGNEPEENTSDDKSKEEKDSEEEEEKQEKEKSSDGEEEEDKDPDEKDTPVSDEENDDVDSVEHHRGLLHLRFK